MVPIVALTLTLACTAERKALRAHSVEEGLLTRSAEIYWRAVRWGDAEKAGNFVQDADDRFALESWLETLQDEWRMVDVRIVRVEVGEEETTLEPPRLREGTIHVRTEGYTLPGQVLKKQTIRQEWYRSYEGWFIDWAESGPLGETDKFRPN